MKQLATQNNTSGATIYDLGNIIQADSMAQLNHVLKATEAKFEAQRREQMESQEKMKQMDIQSQQQQQQLLLDHQAMEKEKDRRRDILVAEIRSAGFGAMQDVNQNMQSDYVDQMESIRKSEEFNQVMNFDIQKNATENQNFRDKQSLEREKLQAQKEMKQTELQIAKENKNKYDVVSKKKSEEKKKK
jgi:hypothetical protein